MESSQPDGLVMKLKGQVNDAGLPLLEGKPCYNGKDTEEEESKPADQDSAVSKENSPPQLSPISPASSSDTVDLAENGLQKCKDKNVSKEENIGTSVENIEIVAKLPIEGTSFITENENEELSVEKLNNKELTNATQNVPTTESSLKNAMDCSGDAPVVKVDSTKELRKTEAPVLDGKVSPINETKDKNTEDTNNLLTASNKIVETSVEKRETADKPEIIPTPMFEDITEDEDSENDESLENIELELDDLIEPLELSKSGCSSDKEKCEFSPNTETDKDVLVLDSNIVKSKILENMNQSSAENMETSSVGLSDVKSTDTLVSNSETSVKENVSDKVVLGTTEAVIQDNCPDIKEKEGKVIQLPDSKAVNGTAGAPQVKKPKVTARKSGKPESVPLKINLHPIKNITMTLSEVEKALDFNPARDLESSKLKSSESSKTNYTSTDTTPLDCSSENSALKNIAGLKKKRRKKTYDFPGCKKKPRKLKSDEMESVGSSADSFSLSDGDFPDTDVNKEASFQDNESASLPKKPESALDILTKNAYLGFTKKPKSSISPSSLSSSTSSKPTSGKSNKIRTVLEMLHERSRQKAESDEKKAASTTLTTLSVTSNSTTTTTTILVSPPHNKPVVEGLKRKGTPRKRREEVICLSDSDDSDAKKNSLVEGKRKRESLDEVSQASSSSPHKPSQHTKSKNISSTSQSPVVMVVAQHSVAPGLRSLLPRQAPAMSSKSVQPPASNLLNTIPLISTLPMGAKAISIANLPPGVAVPLASLPQGTQQAMTFFAPVPAVTAIPVSFSPGQMSVNSPKQVHAATHKTARSGSVPSSPSGKSAKTSLSPSHTSSDSLRALLVGKPYTLARVSSSSATQLATSPMLFQMVTTSGASLVPISAQPLTLTPSSSSVGNSMLKPASAVAGSKTSYSLIKSHPSNLPNGVSCLTPPKTPETDSSSEVVVAASLSRPVAGQVEDSEVIPLCCCKINGASFNKLFSGVTYCQALDTVDNKVLGCCNKVTNTQLVRPGVKIPFMAVCEVHRRRLKLHQCCPGCGHFCSQGKFQQCRKEGKSSVHNFHKQCMFYRSGKYYCPHCGEETTQCEVELKLNDQKPEEGKVIPQRVTKRDTERKTARLGFRNFVKSKSTNEQPKETISLSNNKVINIGSLPLGPDHQALSKLCRCTAEDRPKKYRTIPKDLYTPAMEGDLEKVFYLLMDGVDPNKRYEDHDDQTAMHAAAISGSLATVFILEQYGAEIHAQDRTLRTPMMCAAENGNLNVVQFLIKAGAKVEDRGEDGMTSLHYAAKAGYIDIIQHILEADKLDINIQDDGGWTPIIWATESQLADIVRYLLKQGGDPNKKDNEENTGLHWAAFSGSLEIAEMFIDMGCEIDAINEHGDRPLHIAARQDHYDIVVLLLARGADVDTKNNKDETPVDCCVNKAGQVWMALKVNQQLRSFAARKLIQPERLVERDITMGREKNPIACVNSEDSELCPTDYLYVTENVETSPLNINYVITSLQSCRCKDDCSSMYCVCGRSSIKCWYDKMGHFLEEVNLLEPPLVFECNRACRCWVNCNNRVVQNGITCRLQMFRTNGRGWGVRTLMDIPRGTFVCEYIGELISDSEADRREDDSYLFDLDNKDGDTYCIDARKYGNISRFINHLCEPNLIPVKVFVEHQDLRFPRICLFSSREIKAYEELGFDYGEKFWMIKWKHFTCACKSAKCKYSSETIKKTLADYKLRYPDEVVDV